MGPYSVLFLALEDTWQQYGLIAPAERTTHATDCCVVPRPGTDL
ncbi:hypothetical protein [Streptomyces sp. NPDC093094]